MSSCPQGWQPACLPDTPWNNAMIFLPGNFPPGTTINFPKGCNCDPSSGTCLNNCATYAINTGNVRTGKNVFTRKEGFCMGGRKGDRSMLILLIVAIVIIFMLTYKK